MTNRTLQFWGQGYGSTPATVTVSLGGTTIYTGEVPTIDAPRTPWPDQALLFTAGEIPVEFSGSIPMTYTVNSGTVVFAWIYENYIPVTNPIFTPEQLAILTDPTTTRTEALAIVEPLATPPFSSAELAVLEDPSTPDSEFAAILTAHGVNLWISGGPSYFNSNFWPGDCRENVIIDGVPQSTPIPRPEELSGDWFWELSQGSTLVCDFVTNSGME